MTVAVDPRIGSELAGYRVEALLGRGGMSDVYLAQDLRLKRSVALKLLAPDLARDERFRERVLRSRSYASLDHANVIPVFERVRGRRGALHRHALCGGQRSQERAGRGEGPPGA